MDQQRKDTPLGKQLCAGQPSVVATKPVAQSQSWHGCRHGTTMPHSFVTRQNMGPTTERHTTVQKTMSHQLSQQNSRPNHNLGTVVAMAPMLSWLASIFENGLGTILATHSYNATSRYVEVLSLSRHGLEEESMSPQGTGHNLPRDAPGQTYTANCASLFCEQSMGHNLTAGQIKTASCTRLFGRLGILFQGFFALRVSAIFVTSCNSVQVAWAS